jgi:hypothetical protein
MRIRGNGNVGIGTTSPAEKLVVAGTAQATRIYSDGMVRARGGNYGANSTNTGFTFDGNGDSDGGMFSGADGTLQFYTNGAEKVRLNPSGYVGIGTTNPLEKVSIQDGKLWFTTASSNGDSGGIGGTMASNDFYRIFGAGDNDSGALYIDTYDGAIEPIIFRQVAGQPSGATTAYERMRIASNGFVGINQNTPLAPLHVSGSQANYFYLGGYMGDNGAKDTNENRSDLAHSIIADARMRASSFDVASDSRIKTIDRRSDAAADLTTLLGIEVTDYHYKDRFINGDVAQKKVIAQQVESVYPQAVNKAGGVVPDIYQKATVKDGWVKLVTSLKVGERVQLIGDQGKEIHEVLETREGGFRTGFKPAKAALFVYGREVKDFRSVDYDAIAMLNVSATQQLKREKDAEIKALQGRNAELEARLSALEKLTAVK